MRQNDARALVRAGRFSEALQVIESGPTPTSERLEADVLRVALLERVGRSTQSRHLADRLLRSRHLPAEFESDCRFTLALLDLDAGRTDSALGHLGRALEAAQRAKDLSRACWIQLRMMVVRCNTLGPAGAADWISTARDSVSKLGDPLATAAMYCYAGEVAVKRGALETARRYTDLALSLLDTNLNAWLSALALNNRVALALIECDFHSGIEHATVALRHAIASGGAHIKRACLGNIGNLHALTGSWEQAEKYFLDGLNEQKHGEFNNSILESLAQLHLVSGHHSQAHACLDAIDSTLRCEDDAILYSHRHSRLTRARLQLAEGLHDRAWATTCEAKHLADRSGDQLLRFLADLTSIEILAAQRRRDEAILALWNLGTTVSAVPIEALAQYERTLGLASASESHVRSLEHFRRAAQTFEGLRHQPGLIQVRKSAEACNVPLNVDEARLPAAEHLRPGAVLQDVVGLLLHASHPRTVAIDLVQILAKLGSVTEASAIERDADGNSLPIADFSSGDVVECAASRPYRIGTSGHKSYVITCKIAHNLESTATMNAVGSLIKIVGDLQSRQSEHIDQLDLWSIDESPVDDDGAVITGAMHEVIRLVRRVAPTNAPILITGESGTGKEIVARTIHRYSGRSKFPFVPFNCTAVPRDLLEGHLFGHRRGAFTGAERDHPGVVRSAKDGTLFLDEIGELSLELQPKLLRLLESGEVTPLGESVPVAMTARVIAATNADLEALMASGRFRPDLYYRLCVVPIRIPPLRERRDEIPHLARHFLAKAAGEFGRGRLTFADETIQLLQLYSWPGNLRQLNNEIKRIAAFADVDASVTPDLLCDEVRGARRMENTEASPTHSTGETLAAALARVEREMIASALSTCRGRLDDVAKALGISRKGLYLKRLRLGL